MATRKVYFYKASLFDEEKKELKVDQLKSKIIAIIQKNGHENKGHYSINVSSPIDDLHSILDVFSYKENKFFCRLNKQKLNSSFLKREYNTYKNADVLPSGTEKQNGIELYTFAILEYNTGIISIVSAQGAPGIDALGNLFELYEPSYRLDVLPIMNENGIELLYRDRSPEISKIEVEVPLPNANVLEHIFGWSEDELFQTLCERSLHLNVVVKGEPRSRSPIIFGKDEAQNIIKKMKQCLSRYDKARVIGKIENKKAQDYNFFEENFSYPIDVVAYHIEGHERKYYSPDEFIEIYQKELVAAYKANEKILRTIANR